MRTGTRRGGRKDEEMVGGRCETRGRALIGRLQQASEGGRDGTRERRPLTSSRTNQSVPSTPPSTPWARSTKACLPPAAVEGGPKPGGEPRAGRAVVWNERCERWGWGWKLTVLRPFACEWDEWARAESGRSERASRGSMSGWVWVGWVVGERGRETGKRATQPTGNAGRPIRQLASALWPAFSPLEVRPLPPIRPLSPQPASLSLFSPPAAMSLRRLPTAALRRLPSAALPRQQPALLRPSLLASPLASSSSPAAAARQLAPPPSRRSYTVAAEAKAGAEAEEDVWPKRILPVMSEQDHKLARRQRNIGVCVPRLPAGLAFLPRLAWPRLRARRPCSPCLELPTLLWLRCPPPPPLPPSTARARPPRPLPSLPPRTSN